MFVQSDITFAQKPFNSSMGTRAFERPQKQAFHAISSGRGLGLPVCDHQILAQARSGTKKWSRHACASFSGELGL